MEQLNSFLNQLNTNVFSQPEFMMAIIVFIGMLLMKKKWYEALGSSIKTIVGFYILTAGSDGLTATFKPIIQALSSKFGVNAVVLDTYFTGAALFNETNGIRTMGNSISFALLAWGVAVATNVLLVVFSRITKVRTFFVRNNYNPSMLDMWLFFGILPESARTLPVACLIGVARGVYLAVFSNLTVEASQKLTDGAGLADGHNQMLGAYLADKLGEMIGQKEEKPSGKELPGWLSMFNDNTISTTIVMTLFFGTMMLILGQETMGEFVTIKANTWYGMYVLKTCMYFAVYLNILLLGVRMFAGEIQKAFKGFTSKFIKGGILAVDCAVMFGFSDPAAVMIGFICGFIGQMIAIIGIILLKSPIIIATGFIPMFFDNATLGVYAYRAGGKKAAAIAGLLGGLVQVLGGLVVVNMFYSVGFNVPAYLGTFDGGSLNIVKFALTKYLGVAGIVVLIVLMLIIPQIQYLRHKEGYFDQTGE